MAELPFKILVYRYFFFSWLFKDVNKGDLYEQSVAWRHNRTQAKWLATYLRRWLFMSAMLYGLGVLSELLLHAPLLSAMFYVPMAVGVSINTVIGVLIMAFKTLTGPL
ncbi:MAG: hypothetical protein V4805_03430 [Pseudomonadota bacterium]